MPLKKTRKTEFLYPFTANLASVFVYFHDSALQHIVGDKDRIGFTRIYPLY